MFDWFRAALVRLNSKLYGAEVSGIIRSFVFAVSAVDYIVAILSALSLHCACSHNRHYAHPQLFAALLVYYHLWQGQRVFYLEHYYIYFISTLIHASFVQEPVMRYRARVRQICQYSYGFHFPQNNHYFPQIPVNFPQNHQASLFLEDDCLCHTNNNNTHAYASQSNSFTHLRVLLGTH
jgi:hypothetical protein